MTRGLRTRALVVEEAAEGPGAPALYVLRCLPASAERSPIRTESDETGALWRRSPCPTCPRHVF
jgi:hypothetical protein